MNNLPLFLLIWKFCADSHNQDPSVDWNCQRPVGKMIIFDENCDRRPAMAAQGAATVRVVLPGGV